jgi:tetratricopeptide (TPR) repeat protein
MDEALILQKLDELSKEVRTLKADVLKEVKKELKPAKPTASFFEECLEQSGGEHTREDLAHLVTNLLSNIEMLNSLMATVKGSMELKEEIEPIAKIAYPMAIETAAEVSEGLDPEQIKPLIRNLLSNLENFNTALNMLKAAMELKDDIEPLAKLAYPMAVETIAEVSENLDMEQVKPLIRNTLANLNNFNTALTMLKAGMELKDDIEPLAKLSLPMVIDFFASMTGLMKVSGAALESVKNMQLSDEQAKAMSEVIKNFDLSKTKKVTMFGMIKKLNEPKIQEALGAAFAMLEVFGALLDAHRKNS